MKTQTARRGPLLLLLALSATGCQPPPVVRQAVCPAIPASLTRDCGMCPNEAAKPKTNGELGEAWMDCSECARTYRIRMEAIAELAKCRVEFPEPVVEPL